MRFDQTKLSKSTHQKKNGVLDYFPYFLILLFSFLFLYPVFENLGRDNEELYVSVYSTIAFAKSLTHGIYPFWTSDLGFGMPQPFSQNLIFHPLMPLFAFLTGDVALSIVYLFQIFLSSCCVYRLCRHFEMDVWVSYVVTFTFIGASPLVQYLFVDFWVSAVCMYTFFPMLFFVIIKWLEAVDSREILLYSLLLSLTSAMIVLTGHTGVMINYFIPPGIFLLFFWRKVINRFKWLVLIALITGLLCSSHLVNIFLEYVRFSPGEVIRNISKTGEITMQSLLWGGIQGIFLEGLPVKQLPNSRVLYFGLPFLLSAIWTAFSWKKNQKYQTALVISIACTLILISIPNEIYRQMNIASWPFIFRDPMTLFILLLAGLGLSSMTKQGSKARRWVCGILILQALAVFFSVFPYWYDALTDVFPRTKDVFYKSQIVDRIIQLNRDNPGRVMFSAKAGRAAKLNELTTYGIGLNMLPVFGLHEVTGFFKGIYYQEFFPHPYLMSGTTLISDDVTLQNQNLLSVLNIRYILGFSDEKMADGLQLVECYPGRFENPLCIYENIAVMSPAFAVDDSAKNLRLSRLPHAGHNRLLAADFTPLLSLINRDYSFGIQEYQYGVINLNKNGPTKETIVMVTEYYREDWRAEGRTKDGNLIPLKTFPVVENFIGVQVPDDVIEIRLRYFPIIRVIFAAISWFTLGLIYIFCIILTIWGKLWRLHKDI